MTEIPERDRYDNASHFDPFVHVETAQLQKKLLRRLS